MLVSDNRPTLVLFIGLPGAGKTSYLASCRDALETIRTTITGLEQEVETLARQQRLDLSVRSTWAKLTPEARAIVEQKVRQAVSERRNIVLDQQNLTYEERQRWRNLCRGYRCVGYLFTAPLTLLERILLERQAVRPLTTQDLDRALRAYEPPQRHEPMSVRTIAR